MDKKYWIGFSRIPSLGTKRFRLLERQFPSLEAAWRASLAELTAAGLDEKTAQQVVALRVKINPDAEVDRLEKAGVKALRWNDAGYPPRLKQIHDPPPMLFVRGELLPEDERAVAVVGTRRATAYGREASTFLTGDLARNKVTIISGLARGIDALSHRAALDAGGRTIAVMATGLDIIYPPEHANLAKEIVAHGALVSEHPLGVRPDARYFPRRNRLMSGMSLGVLVVEAPQDSGALWTVRHALEQDREVFCVPGSIFSTASKGTNLLIQEGAKLVMTYKDVLEELNLSVVARQMEMTPVLRPQDDTETLLLKHVAQEPVHIDQLQRQTRLPIAQVSSTLAVMEIKGLVKQVGGMHYVRAREVSAGYAG